MGLLDEAKKHGWWLAIAGTVLGVVLADGVKAVVVRGATWADRSLNPPQIVVRLSDHGPADEGGAVASLYGVQGAQPERLGERRWSGISAVSFGDVQDGYYLIRVEAPAQDGRRRIEVGTQLAGVTREVALPPRSAADWRLIAAATPPPVAAPVVARPGETAVAVVSGGSDRAAAALAASTTLRQFLALPENAPALRWMAIALLELGVSEGGGEADRRRITGYFRDTNLPAGAHSPNTPWSAVWLNWVFARAGVPTPRSGSNAAWLAWGETLEGPRPGALAVLPLSPGGAVPSYHAGLVVQAEPGCVMLVSGNSSNRVEARCFAPARIQSYRWPPSR